DAHRREPRQVHPEGLRRDRRRRHAMSVSFARAVRAARPAGPRRAVHADAAADDSAQRLQGLCRADRALRPAQRGHVPQPQVPRGGRREGRRGMSVQAQPVGGRILTRPFSVLAALFGVAAVLILVRLGLGLGRITAMSDGYPWGLWIAFDVVTGTALACGGYSVALLVYVMNKGKYHPLVRPAILTSALGYTLAGPGVGLDVGRWWSIWHVPLYVWRWNLDSVLLEVALCIMSYMCVLWIELSPAFLERAEQMGIPRLSPFAPGTRPND